MYSFKINSALVGIFLLMSCIVSSCEEDPEQPIIAEYTFKTSTTWSACPIGDHIIIKDFKLTKTTPETGVKIKKVEFFLGNKNIKSCSEPPYELDYEVPETKIGEYIFQIDISLSANGYLSTKIMDKRKINIIERVNDKEH